MVKYTPIRVLFQDIQTIENRGTFKGAPPHKWLWCSVIFLAGLIVKAALVLAFPPLYGGDTVFHLRNREHLLLSHQLPMLQILIYITYKVTSLPIVIRALMVVIGALSGTGFYLLCLRLISAEGALWAALCFVTNPFLNEVSIVPFQEMLMVGALCFALYFYFAERFLPAALGLAFACLTRQEAWLLCPLLIIDYSKCRNWKAGDVLTACALFACAPALWVAVHVGLSSPGTYTLEVPRTLGRFVRWIYLAWVTVKETPLPVLAFAAVAAIVSYRDKARLSRGVILFSGVLVLYLVAILCAAHGIGHPGIPNPELFISAREATLLVSLTLVLAAFGVNYLLEDDRWERIAWWMVSLAVLLGLIQSFFLVASQTAEPHTTLSYQAASFVEANARPNEKLLVVAKPFTPDDWNYFLLKATQLQGQKGADAAKRILRESDLAPMDLQRIAVQTSLPQDCFVADANPAMVNWLIIWNDVAEPVAVEKALGLFHRVREFKDGRLAVTIWRK